MRRNGQRKKHRDRLSAHGRNIAEPARQAAVANCFGRMPFATEVNTLHAQVSSD
jgi:hypothetical protein